MTARLTRIAIIGAGKLGITLAQLATKAGYDVYIASSTDPERITPIVQILAPGAIAMTTEAAAERAELIVLALPLGKFRTIPPELFADKLVIDAMNYWWEVDGDYNNIIDASTTSSQAVQVFFSTARIVKGLNHMGYHHLHDEARPLGESGRKAIAIAGDNPADTSLVAYFVDSLGFDPLIIGDLASGRALEPGAPAFGANIDKKSLQDLIMR